MSSAGDSLELQPPDLLLERALEIEAALDRELEQVRSTLESQPPEPATHPEAVVTRHVREPLAPSSWLIKALLPTSTAILGEITAPLTTLGDDPVAVAADVDFSVVLRGYDRVAVDAYVKRTSQLVAELEVTRSPEAAIRRAIERVGEQVSGILRRAHDSAGQITARSRAEAEAEDRLEVASQEAAQIAAAAGQRLKDLDADTDRIWRERRRIVEDARELAGQLIALAESANERFGPLGRR